MRVKLKDVVDMLEFQMDDYWPLLDMETGEVVSVSADLVREAEAEEEDEEEYEDEEWELAKLVVADWQRFRRLPTQFDVNEWEIMRQFALHGVPERVGEQLERALHGKGAFRYFKDTARRLGVEKEWYAYRSKALEEIARAWGNRFGAEWV
jgi:hypothetical protein